MRQRDVGRMLVGAVVVGMLGVGAVLAQDGRTFGPDTTSTGVFTGQGTTTPGLTCDSPPAPTARTCTGFLASSLDGSGLLCAGRSHFVRVDAEHAADGWSLSIGAVGASADGAFLDPLKAPPSGFVVNGQRWTAKL